MQVTPFVNEPYTDFSKPEAQAAAMAALAKVRGELGRDYDLIIAGERVQTADKMISTNPSNVSEQIGSFSKASAELATKAIESAHEYFSEWSQTPPEYRAELAMKVAAIIRSRKMEFNAWLVLEAGKTWPEAEPEVAEAVDFCEYYARLMMKLAKPDALVQMPGEKGELVYLPLGAGVIIPPWNFPLAILAGMTVAALTGGNTVVIKPSSETPAIAAKFVEVLIEAGYPMKAFSFAPGSGAVIGDLLVEHPKTRFISFTGSRDVGLRINELAAKPRKGQIWIKRVVAEMGGKDAIIVDSETDLETAVNGVFVSAFGYQGQKCSACSRVIVDASHYDEFLVRLQARVDAIAQGPTEKFETYMGAVISASARKSILEYIEIGRKEGRIVTGGGPAEGNGHYIKPTVIADVEPKHRVFQEEIFGPVLTVTKANGFDEALAMANDTEYGLTGAVYTDNREKIEKAKKHFFVGNLYINRKCTGAMVGAHPFGGFNMSGTDSKAGGPDYMLQFVQPKSIAERIG